VHPNALSAAKAAACADRQGRFWSYHDLLFLSADTLPELNFERLAALAKIADTTAFRRCMDSGQSSDAVQHDILLGRSLGIDVTPTIVVNGHLIPGLADKGFLESYLGEKHLNLDHSSRARE
jgi:protein-disulfide isomerase